MIPAGMRKDGIVVGLAERADPDTVAVLHGRPGDLERHLRSDQLIRSGTRAGTGCWTWNGSTDAPTLRPSVLTRGHREGAGDFRCHSWITDGQAQFLDDCDHALRNSTVDLIDSDDHPSRRMILADPENAL